MTFHTYLKYIIVKLFLDTIECGFGGWIRCHPTLTSTHLPLHGCVLAIEWLSRSCD